MSTEPKPVAHDCVLIDDDSLVHMTWKMQARALKKSILTFFTEEEFIAKSPDLDLDTPVYVDLNLGNGVSGKDVSHKVHEMGFKNIFICTGNAPDDCPTLPWIKGIIGKEPPW